MLSLLYVFLKPLDYLKSSFGISGYIFDLFLVIYKQGPVQRPPVLVLVSS